MSGMFLYAQENQIIPMSPVGHANIGVTMNLYVHITEDGKEKEIREFGQAFKVG